MRQAPPSRRATMWIAVAGVGLAIAFALDLPVHAMAVSNLAAFEKRDLVQCLRSGGYWPAWLVVAAAMMLVDARSAGGWSLRAIRRGWTLLSAVTIAGITSELVKLVARRERINSSGAFYHYRPVWVRPFDTSGLSMPSSHAIVVFAAAFTLGRQFPAARPVLFLFAIGTAATRVLSGAHFLSDVYVSVLLAWCASAIVENAFARYLLRRRPSTMP